MSLQPVFDAYLAALRTGDRRAAFGVARKALDSGVDVRDLYMQVFQPAMHEVGNLWESNQITVAEEHLATAITQSLMAQVYNDASPRAPHGHSLVATAIGGELHELGIRMVADFFELDGWDVYYLGVNVPQTDVISTIAHKKPHLLALSVTLNSHLLQARELIQAVRAAPAGAGLKILVGGQPFNRNGELHRTIGADLVAGDAREAVLRAREALR
jgi:MerR family transcriptional regulator, light-induced transcriptional regulator